MLDLNNLLSVGLVLIVAGIVLAFGLQVTADIKSDMTTDSAEYNATGNVIDGVSKVTSKFPTIGLVVAAVIIIGLLISGFSFAKR
jgi:hypothetical protein